MLPDRRPTDSRAGVFIASRRAWSAAIGFQGALRMAERRRLSVKTSVQTAWAVMLGAVVLPALVFHQYVGELDTERLRNAAAYTTARTVGDQLRLNASAPREVLQRSCNHLIQQPGVWAVGLWNRSNELTALASLDPNLEHFLGGDETVKRCNGVDVVRLPSGLIPNQQTVRRAEVDLGFPGATDQLARMVILFDPQSPPGSGSSKHLSYHASVVGIGLAVWLLGSWWIRREFLRPILALIEPSPDDKADRGRRDVVERDDELGAIARSLEGLQGEIQEWRERAAMIERRMDSQVAAETQRISRELRRLQREAWLDPLTRVGNRRLCDEKFPSIFAAQREARHDLSVVMFDLDHFKRTNDLLGHAVGDALLKFAGELLRQCIRSDDFAVRYGGDEFLLILPGVSAEDATALAKRIAAMFVQRAKMIADIQPPPSISAGVASILQDMPKAPCDLFRAADAALYRAKREGGRKVCRSEGLLPRRRAV